MEKDFKTRIINTFYRDLIKKDGGKITYFQILGLLLIGIGIAYFIIFPIRIKYNNTPPDGIAIAFFITMLGVAFAFPDLLKGQTKDLSTMRIIVFMFSNVICMLLLKIGWEATSLEEIGLDTNWMGVIAFLFGAKAAQRYFENVKHLKNSSDDTKDETPKPSDEESQPETNINISQIAIAQIAKVQNEENLHDKFTNLEYVSDTVNNGKSCLTLYFKENVNDSIPSFVMAQINEKTAIKVPTEVITNMGEGKPHIAQLTNNVADSKTPQFLGSLCCLVESTLNSSIKGVLTSGHIFTNGNFINYNGFVNSSQASVALSNGINIGKLYYQQMVPNQDIAIVKLNDGISLSSELKHFPNGFYDVTDKDLNSLLANVTIFSKDNKKRDAFIVDWNVSMRIYYTGTQKIMRNIILIGSHADKNNSATVSKSGDSGSCVFHKQTEKLIGMLLGGNDKFSFVLPFKQTLLDNNLKLN